MRLPRMLSVTGSVAGIAALMMLSAGPGAAATEASGTATALSASASVLGALQVNLGTPTAVFPAGGRNAVLDLELGNKPINLGVKQNLAKLSVLEAFAKVQQDSVHTHAHLVNVDLLGLIHVDVLQADCLSNANGATGSSDIVGVTIGGKPISPQVISEKITANNPVPLNGILSSLLTPLVGKAVTITFDEHIRNGAALTVNALHVHVDTALLPGLPALPALLNSDIVIGQATCTAGEVAGGGTGGTGGGGTGGTPAPTGSQGPGGSSTATAPASAPTSTTVPGVANASNNLPFTGVAGIGPMIIGAVLLVAAGGGLFWVTRRRKAAHNGSGDS